MFLYTAIEAIVGVVAGILIAVCTKKADGVIYSKLDKIGRVTNILLLLFYVGFSFFYLFLGTIANPRYDGFLGILGWIVSIIMASQLCFAELVLACLLLFVKKQEQIELCCSVCRCWRYRTYSDFVFSFSRKPAASS